MSNTFKIQKRIILLFCTVFTFATLASCFINLWLGHSTDTYFHILDRAFLTLIGSIVINIMMGINLQNKFLNLFTPYLIFILLAFLYVFISGFFEELHPNAYRDIFINDTIAYIVVAVGVHIYKKIQLKHYSN